MDEIFRLLVMPVKGLIRRQANGLPDGVMHDEGGRMQGISPRAA